MAEPTKRRSSNRSCLVYCAGIFILLPIVLIGATIALLAARDRSARRQLENTIAQLQAENLPTNSPSMQDFYERHTSKETTVEWLELLATLESQAFRDSIAGVPIFDPKVEVDVPGPGEPWNEEEATRAFLVKWDDTHQKITDLCAEGLPVRFPIIWDSINTKLENTQQMRGAARLLQLRTQTAIFDRDSAATANGIQSLLGCSHTLSGEPILVSQLVSLAIDNMAIRSLQQAIEHDVLSQADLQKLRSAIQPGQSISEGWRLGLIGERAMMLDIFENPSAIGPANMGAPVLPFRSTDANNYMNLMQQAIDVKTEDFDEFLTGLSEHEEEIQKLTSGSIFGQLDSIMTGLLTPALSAAGQAYTRSACKHRLAEIAIGVRLFEKQNGRLPKELEELQTIDIKLSGLRPNGGKPFGYRVNQEQAVLWGFDLSSGDSEVPDEPPVAEEGSPSYWQNEEWIWTLHVGGESK